LRRTLFYLEQCPALQLRENVRVLALGYRLDWFSRHAREFLFWHWAQLQYHNPKMQLIKLDSVSMTPFAQAFLDDGREVLFDLDGKDREQIVTVLNAVLGKTQLVRDREHLEELQHRSPASFGSGCERECMCEVQGQHPCTCTLIAPRHLRGRWRWNHNLI